MKWIESWFYRTRKKAKKTATQSSNALSSAEISTFKSEYQDPKLSFSIDKEHTANPRPKKARRPLRKLIPSQTPTIKREQQTEDTLLSYPVRDNKTDKALLQHETMPSAPMPYFMHPHPTAFSHRLDSEMASASDFSSNHTPVAHKISTFSVPFRQPQNYQASIASTTSTSHTHPGYNPSFNSTFVADKYFEDIRPPPLDAYNAHPDTLQARSWFPEHARTFTTSHAHLKPSEPSPFCPPRIIHAVQPPPRNDIVTPAPSSQTIANSFPYYQYSRAHLQHSPSSWPSLPSPVIERRFAKPTSFRPNAHPTPQTSNAEDFPYCQVTYIHSLEQAPSLTPPQQLLLNVSIIQSRLATHIPFHLTTPSKDCDLPHKITTLLSPLYPPHPSSATSPLDNLTTPLKYLTALRDTHNFGPDVILSRLLDEELIQSDPFQAAMGLVFLSRLGLEWDTTYTSMWNC